MKTRDRVKTARVMATQYSKGVNPSEENRFMTTVYSKGLKMYKASYKLDTGVVLSRLGETRQIALHSLVIAFNHGLTR